MTHLLGIFVFVFIMSTFAAMVAASWMLHRWG